MTRILKQNRLERAGSGWFYQQVWANGSAPNVELLKPMGPIKQPHGYAAHLSKGTLRYDGFSFEEGEKGTLQKTYIHMFFCMPRENNKSEQSLPGPGSLTPNVPNLRPLQFAWARRQAPGRNTHPTNTDGKRRCQRRTLKGVPRKLSRLHIALLSNRLSCSAGNDLLNLSFWLEMVGPCWTPTRAPYMSPVSHNPAKGKYTYQTPVHEFGHLLHWSLYLPEKCQRHCMKSSRCSCHDHVYR